MPLMSTDLPVSAMAAFWGIVALACAADQSEHSSFTSTALCESARAPESGALGSSEQRITRMNTDGFSLHTKTSASSRGTIVLQPVIAFLMALVLKAHLCQPIEILSSLMPHRHA